MVLVGSRELFECTRKTLVLAKWELPFLSDMLIFFFLSSHAFHCSLFQCFYMLFYMFQCFPILMRCVGFQFWRSLNSDVSSLILLLYSGIFKFYCSVCKLRLAMASTLFSAIFKCFFEMNDRSSCIDKCGIKLIFYWRYSVIEFFKFVTWQCFELAEVCIFVLLLALPSGILWYGE